MLCRATSRSRHSHRLVCLLGFLRSHVLRAHCNFESKQAISITLFGPRTNKNLLSYLWKSLRWKDFEKF